MSFKDVQRNLYIFEVKKNSHINFKKDTQKKIQKKSGQATATACWKASTQSVSRHTSAVIILGKATCTRVLTCLSQTPSVLYFKAVGDLLVTLLYPS